MANRRPIAGTADPQVTKVTVTRGGPAFGHSPTMDRFLSEEDKAILYERWSEDWPHISLPGGGSVVTCEQFLQVPWADLSKAYGPKRAGQFKTIAENQRV